MGRVYLNDENKLVVETDNGKIEGDKTTTILKNDETYEVDIITISKLLALLNDVTLCDEEMYHRGYYFTIISKEKLAECVEKERLRAHNNANEYHKIKKRLIDLVDRVRKFNSDKKVFWRPINIDGVCVN